MDLRDATVIPNRETEARQTGSNPTPRMQARTRAFFFGASYVLEDFFKTCNGL